VSDPGSRIRDVGDVAAVKAAATAGVNLDDLVVETDQGPQRFLDAVLRRQDPELLEQVLALPGLNPVRALPEYGFWAWARHTTPAVVRLLLQRSGLDPDHADAAGRSLLIELASGPQSPDPDLTAWLITGHDINHPADDGTTAFFHAVLNNHLELATQLLAAGTDPDVANRNNGATALIIAVALRQDPLVRWLLKLSRLDPNRSDDTGSTALHLAARLGSAPVVQALVEDDRTDPNRADVDGRTPLIEAARHVQVDAVTLLLGRPDTDVNRVDDDRRTALHHAVLVASVPIVRALLQRDDLNLAVTDRPDRHTALELAEQAGPDELVLLLSDRSRSGPSPDQPSNESPVRSPRPRLLDPHAVPGIADPVRRQE
jgi:hypothetical protein